MSQDGRLALLERNVAALREIVSGQAAMLALLVAHLSARNLMSDEDVKLILAAGVQGRADGKGQEKLAWVLENIVRRGG